jgi:hypothetical protein
VEHETLNRRRREHERTLLPLLLTDDGEFHAVPWPKCFVTQNLARRMQNQRRLQVQAQSAALIKIKTHHSQRHSLLCGIWAGGPLEMVRVTLFKFLNRCIGVR